MTNDEVERVKLLAWSHTLTPAEVRELQRLALQMVSYVDISEGFLRALGVRQAKKP